MSPFPSDRDDGSQPVIRAARRSDIDALVAIEHAAFPGDRLSRRSFLRLIESPSALALVAARGDAVLGGCIVLLRSYSHRARLYSLAVAPSSAGQGIGSELLAAAEKLAGERGCKVMTLEVREDNRPARSLYERFGFELSGRTSSYYSDGEAALHFRKQLGAAALQGAAA